MNLYRFECGAFSDAWTVIYAHPLRMDDDEVRALLRLHWPFVKAHNKLERWEVLMRTAGFVEVLPAATLYVDNFLTKDIEALLREKAKP